MCERKGSAYAEPWLSEASFLPQADTNLLILLVSMSLEHACLSLTRAHTWILHCFSAYGPAVCVCGSGSCTWALLSHSCFLERVSPCSIQPCAPTKAPLQHPLSPSLCAEQCGFGSVFLDIPEPPKLYLPL